MIFALYFMCCDGFLLLGCCLGCGLGFGCFLGLFVLLSCNAIMCGLVAYVGGYWGFYFDPGVFMLFFMVGYVVL